MRRFAFGVMFAALLMPLRAAAQETVEYYGTDAIGSIRIVFDANGNIIGRMDYGPFGEQVTVSTVGHKSYAGLFRDGEAGLDYAEARSYQVRTGRFSAPDPVYGGLFQPQAWNRYSYALNNPLTFVDPTGMQADSCTTVDTYTKDGENWVLNTTLKCKDNGSNGGGGSIPLEMMWFFTFGSSVPYRGAESEGSASFEGFVRGVASFFGSFVPGVGEAQDVDVILDEDSSLLAQLLAGGSLVVSVATAGASPNVGASAAQGVRLGHRLAAEEIAGGHAFGKHVLERGEFPGIRTRSQFADMIEGVMGNPSDIRQLSGGRTAFWKDGVVVIRHPSAADGGTVFVPTTGYKYFLGLK